MCKRTSIGGPAIGDDNQRAAAQCGANTFGARHAGGRVRRGNPQRLHLAVEHRIKKVDRLQAWPRGKARCVPERLQPSDIAWLIEAHMRCELIRQTADFAPSHGVWLTGQREWAHAWPTNAAGGEVAVQDRIDAVRAIPGLIHALGICRHDTFGAREPGIESFQCFGVDAAIGRYRFDVRRIGASRSDSLLKPVGVTADPPGVERVTVGEISQQSVEQCYIRTGRERQMQIRGFRGRTATRINDDDARAARGLGGHETLMQHRMAPRRIAPNQDDKIGLFEIIVHTRHDIFAERTHMTGHR
jgi:hypothetical protein